MDQKIEKAQHVLIQVILANTSSAMKISKILLEHSNRDILSADDIICGLIYRLMIPMSDNEIKDSMETANDIMCEESSDGEYSDDNYEIVDDKDDLNIKREIKPNQCNCDICSQVRVCLHNFNDYIPKDELADKFKKTIIDTCKSHNRII